MINPDGKIVKRGNSIGCGSMNMNLQNGLWNRFSSGDSGNVFGLVALGMGVNKLEALEIVAEHAGIKPEGSGYFRERNKQERYNHSAANNKNSVKKELRDDWLLTDIRGAKAFEPNNDLKFMLKNNKISEIYEYKSISNELLGYTVRMQDIKTNKKQVLPVAYCHNEKLDKSRWQLKGFSDAGTKPIYGIEKLAENPEKPILIVEGEKTADAASKLLPDYNVISWMGGAQAVNKVDWSKLSSRSVAIWPDNDKPGIEAAKNIANHIDCHNGFTGLVSVIDTEKLGLPTKWDLADELPKDSDIATSSLSSIMAYKRDTTAKVGKQLELSQESITNTGNAKEIPDSINMLVATNRISKDEYLSQSLYYDSVTLIANSKGVDLSEVKAGDAFVSKVKEIQDEYQTLHREYERNSILNKQASNNIDNDHSQTTLSTKEQLAHDLIRDTSVLHQVQLGQNKLTAVHTEHIAKTVNAEIEKMQRFTDSDKEYAANNIHKVINSEKWLEQLELKNHNQYMSAVNKFKDIKTEITQIRSTLSNMHNEKQLAPNLYKTMESLNKEQKFLCSLYDKVENISKYDFKLSHDIESAYLDRTTNKNTLNQLLKTTNYAENANILSEDKLIEHYKSTHNLDSIHEQIKQSCFKQHCQIITEHYNHIDAGRTIEHDGHKFDCTTEYLEHWKSNVDHKLLPIKYINDALEHDHQRDHDEIDHHYHGMEM